MVVTSIRMLMILTILTGVIYPLAVTGISQVIFPDKANGSLIFKDGQAIGSTLIAQPFKKLEYFWPRPSAANFATVPSGASNQGPTSKTLQAILVSRREILRNAHHLASHVAIPDELILASGSGLDPHISPEAAVFQADRVAVARYLSTDTVLALIDQMTEPPQMGLLGQPRLNVLQLNMALDQ